MTFSDFLGSIFNVREKEAPKEEVKRFNSQDMTSTWKPLGARNVSSIADFARELPSLTYPVIEQISNDFATIGLKLLYSPKKNTTEEIKVHPAITSLKEPNPSTSAYDLLKQYAMYMLVTGESYWYVTKGAGNTKQIYTLSPLNLIRIDEDSLGNITAYYFRVQKAGGSYGEQKFLPEEILMDKNVNLDNLTRGFSPFNPVREGIDASEGAIGYNNRFFSNNATPSGIIKVKSGLTPATKEALKTDWTSKFRGADKSFGLAVVEGDMEFQAIGTPLKDMAFRDLMEVAEKRILANWRIPKTVLGQSEDVNRATIEGAELNYSKRVLKPMFDKFVAFLNLKYLPLFVDRITLQAFEYRFDYENPVAEDILTNSEIAVRGVAQKPFMSINEAREMVGLTPIKNSKYDEIPEVESMQPVDNEKALLKQAIKSLRSDLKSIEGFDEAVKMQREEEGKQHLEKALKREKSAVKAIREFFSEQEARIIAKVEKKDVHSSIWFDLASEVSKMVVAVKSPFEKAAIGGWKDANVRIGIDQPIDDFKLAQIVKAVTEKFAVEVNENTAKYLNDLLGRAVKEGLSVDEVAKEIRSQFSEYKTSRARTIATTEINAVVTEATLQNYSQAKSLGIIESMEWLTVGDSRVRDSHRSADGQVVPIGSKFNVGGELMTAPGDVNASVENRVNCRCAVLPVL